MCHAQKNKKWIRFKNDNTWETKVKNLRIPKPSDLINHVVPPHRVQRTSDTGEIALPNPLWWIFVGFAYMVRHNH
jgi:hypothetical protein